MVEKSMTAEDALGASGDESFCLAVLWGRLTLRDEGAQDVQTVSPWVVVRKDTDLSCLYCPDCILSYIDGCHRRAITLIQYTITMKNR